jgi:hypothetical protein
VGSEGEKASDDERGEMGGVGVQGAVVIIIII